MTGLLRALDRFWFAGAPAARPALLRLLVGGYLLVYLGRRYGMLLRVARSDPALFRPVGVVAALERPLPVGVFRGLLGATLLANVAFLLGWRHRQTGPLFAGLLLWVMSYRNSWSMIYHNDNVLVLHAIILGLTPAADALSLDAARGRDPAPSLGGGEPAGDWRHGWPVRLMTTVTLLTYFLAGVAKLAGPLGRGWAGGEALRGQVAVDGLRKALLGEGATPLAYALYDKVWLFRLMAAGSLVLELVAPLALADRRLAPCWALGAWLLHWGIYAVMGITFRYQLSSLIYASFFDLERALARLAPPRPVGPGRG